MSSEDLRRWLESAWASKAGASGVMRGAAPYGHGKTHSLEAQGAANALHRGSVAPNRTLMGFPQSAR
jgi:hypothetical protein